MASRIYTSLKKLFGRQMPPPAASSHPTVLRASDDLMFIVDEVKRGGMGVVYICHLDSLHPSLSGQRFALKTFDEKYFFDVTMAGVVRRETAIWTRLADVPFVLPLMTTVTIDGKPHLVMPAVEPDAQGVVSFADAIRRAPDGLPPTQTYHVALCLATALSLAAKVIPGVAHGDIKPDNILYLHGRPFLADFGLAGLSGEPGRRGTAPYMAPELWLDAGTPTLRSDLYAYGVTLLEALTGRLPFEAAVGDDRTWTALHRTAAIPALPQAIAGDELAQRIHGLAAQCLAKDPAGRPDAFTAAVVSLMEWGLRLAPSETLDVIEITTHHSDVAADQRSVTTDLRVRDLLGQNDVESAIEILKQLPDEEVQGRLVLTAGSAWSLAGDDEKALQYFERFLSTNPSEDDRLRCLNEKGLSLRRLDRLNEAKDLFEQLMVSAVGHPERLLAARGNYAAVLLDLGEIDDAKRQLEWILRRHPESVESQAIYAETLERSGDLERALAAIERAIALEPRAGVYHVIRAHLALRLGRLGDALQSVDASYELGFHSPRWLTVALAVHLALGRPEEVEGLTRTARQHLPAEAVDHIEQDAMAYLREIATDTTPDATPPPRRESLPDPLSTPAVASALPETPEPPAPAEAEAADVEGSREQSIEDHRRAIREGRATHVQFRMSFIDHSFAVDFYSNVESPTYVARFRKGYAEAKTRMETQVTDERQAPYRFARCTHCGVSLLTARDPGERFTCQGCGEKGPIVFVESERLAAIAAECDRAIGRRVEEPSIDGGAVMLAFWIEDEGLAARIAERMVAEGFTAAPADAPIFSFFLHERRKRDRAIDREPAQIWHRAVTAADRGFEGETPPSVDLLLRGLRREFGQLQSASMTVDEESAAFMLGDPERRLQIIRQRADASPNDRALKSMLVAAELAVGHLEDARRLAVAMETARPDDSEALIAAAQVALAESRPADAAPRLERVVAAEPRNQAARLLLVRAYSELNEPDEAARHASEFRKLGGTG